MLLGGRYVAAHAQVDARHRLGAEAFVPAAGQRRNGAGAVRAGRDGDGRGCSGGGLLRATGLRVGDGAEVAALDVRDGGFYRRAGCLLPQRGQADAQIAQQGLARAERLAKLGDGVGHGGVVGHPCAGGKSERRKRGEREEGGERGGGKEKESAYGWCVACDAMGEAMAKVKKRRFD